jgi:hypothetical protein
LNIHDVAGADHFDAAAVVAAVDDERNGMKFHVCNPPEGRIYTLLLMLLLLSSGILVVVRLPQRCHRHMLILMMMMRGPEEVEEVPPNEIDDHYSFPLDFIAFVRSIFPHFPLDEGTVCLFCFVSVQI